MDGWINGEEFLPQDEEHFEPTLRVRGWVQNVRRLFQASGHDAPEVSPWGGVSGHIELQGNFQATQGHVEWINTYPQKTEKSDTMADTHLQLWLRTDIDTDRCYIPSIKNSLMSCRLSQEKHFMANWTLMLGFVLCSINPVKIDSILLLYSPKQQNNQHFVLPLTENKRLWVDGWNNRSPPSTDGFKLQHLTLTPVVRSIT